MHVHLAAVEGDLCLSDLEFVLRPKARYTAEWAIVPVARPDYFAFLNSARRLLDANFTIPLLLCLPAGAAHTQKWSDRQFADFVRFKSANVVCASIDSPMYKGHYTHGTAFQLVSHDSYRRWVERVRRLAPQAKSLIYFHCFIDVLEDADRKFADARVLRADGSQADYGEPHDKIFFPLKNNSFGRQSPRTWT